MKILICGDSFAADYTVKYSGKGWVNYIAEKNHVVNIAQAGCGEYKIYKQLYSQIKNLKNYDRLIISHTSPYRIHVENHPFYAEDLLHKNCDFIYNDVADKKEQCAELACVAEYFENFYNLEYAKFTHSLICEKIETIVDTAGIQCLHIANTEWNDLYNFKNMLNFYNHFLNYRGIVNHYSDEGNRIIFQDVLERLEKIDK
jgi:hypothetical protein|tara:strand:- start:100 stop:702 length:603 start_codon:yes stop_codon:yes gene_type:complete